MDAAALWPVEAALRRRGRLLGRSWLRVSWGSTWGAIASSCYVASRVPLVFLVYPLTQWQAEQSLVVAEPGPVVTRQSTEAFGRISISTLWCCLRYSHLEILCTISFTSSFLAVFTLCVWVLPVEFGSWIFERSWYVTRAQYLVRQWIHLLHQCSGGFWTNCTHFQRQGRLGSRGVLSPLRCRMEKSADASGCSSALRCSHLEI